MNIVNNILKVLEEQRGFTKINSFFILIKYSFYF